ncbi:MAG TPA: sugar-binding protein [Myxococcota bacterium]|nr:sugar-binding protein [Myxococcota bacterium]
MTLRRTRPRAGRWAAAGLALALVAVTAGCGRREVTAPAPKVLRFAFLPKALSIPVFEYARIGAERAARELGGIEILWRAPEVTDELRQKEILESFVTQKVDGIALSALNGDLLTPSIDAAVAAGIPVVTWDSDAPASKRAAFYGVDDFEGGKVLGEGLVRLLGGKGRVAILSSLGADNLQKRTDGAKSALAAAPGIEIVEVYDVKDDAIRAAEILASATQAHPDLDGWLSVGGWPVFLRNALDPVDPARTKVVAFDTIPPAPELVREGKVQLLVGQKYFGWGYESVKLLARLARGEQLERSHYFSGVDVVTPENVDAYEAQWKAWLEGSGSDGAVAAP